MSADPGTSLNGSLFCRILPKPVIPVVENGVQYSSTGDGKTAYVVATEVSTGKQLWKAAIFRVHPRIWKGEEDN